MNTGIMDAYNLAWKLALVASGHAPDRLLDSYGQERGPLAAGVLALTHALVTLSTMTHPAQRALRNTVIPLAGRLAPVQRRAARRMGQLHVSYPSSPLTAPAAARRTPAGRASTRSRCDRPPRTDPAVRSAAPRTARAPDLRAQTATGRCRLGPWQNHVESSGHRTAAGGAGGGPAPGVYLLRPDGYVAARGPRPAQKACSITCTARSALPGNRPAQSRRRWPGTRHPVSRRPCCKLSRRNRHATPRRPPFTLTLFPQPIQPPRLPGPRIPLSKPPQPARSAHRQAHRAELPGMRR